MERVLANISASLVAPKNLNQVITSALEEIGKFMGLSRVYMMEASLPKKVLDITYEWCAPNIPSRWNQLWGIPLESLPQWMESILPELNQTRETVAVPRATAARLTYEKRPLAYARGTEPMSQSCVVRFNLYWIIRPDPLRLRTSAVYELPGKLGNYF